MKNRISINLLIFFLSFSNHGLTQIDYAQRLLDSLEKVDTPILKAKLYNDLGFYFASFDSLQANLYTRKALKIASENNLLKEKGDAYKNFGAIEGNLHYAKNSIHYYDTAFQIYQAIPDTSGMIAVLNNSGRRYCYIGECEKGIQKYHLAESWIKTEDVYKLLVIRINHAICLMECRAYKDCLKLGEESLSIAKEEGIKATQFIFHFHLLIANAASNLQQYDKANKHFEAAEAFSKELDNSNFYAAVLNDKGSSLVAQGLYEQAYTAFSISLNTTLEDGNLQNDYRIYLNLGEVTKKLGKYRESIQFFEKGLQGSELTDDFVVLADSYEMAAETYHLIGKNEEAYQYMAKAEKLRDTVFTNEMRQNLQEITTRYETQKITQELTVSKLKIEQEKNRNRLTLISGISLLIFSGITYLFFLGRQRRRRLETEKRKIELEYGLLRAQMNPHFIFNSLNSIQGFFAENDFVQGNEFLGKFSRLVRRVLDQSVAPAILVSEELETLKLYLDVEKIRLKDNLTYHIQVEEKVESDLINVPPLILQPFVENAIWHGIAPKNAAGHIDIFLTMNKMENALLVTIEDNGIGLTTKNTNRETGHLSKGIQITKERLGKNGQVKVINKIGSADTGVKIKLKIPLVDYD